jgi:hypothetical protein
MHSIWDEERSDEALRHEGRKQPLGCLSQSSRQMTYFIHAPVFLQSMEVM